MSFIHRKISDYLKENKNYDDFFITYNEDKYVYHITSLSNQKEIEENGFKTGYELDKSERRKAIYFSDKDVNYGMYARNDKGEIYEGEEIGEIKVNIKGLKLLNLSYKEDGVFVNHKKYNTFVVRGELHQIPYEIDGAISFLEDGRIYEVCLKKYIANNLLEKNR